MKINIISNPENARENYITACNQGYITFIYLHADPERKLLDVPFMYVESDAELAAKTTLLELDLSILMGIYEKVSH